MIIGASSGPGFIFIIVIGFLLLYLIVVRPQKKRQAQQQQMNNELRVGDEVLTVGGIYGTVSRVDEDEVTVQIAPATEVRVARRAIAGVTRDEEEDATADDEAPQEEAPEEEGSEDEEGSGGDASNEEHRG